MEQENITDPESPKREDHNSHPPTSPQKTDDDHAVENNKERIIVEERWIKKEPQAQASSSSQTSASPISAQLKERQSTEESQKDNPRPRSRDSHPTQSGTSSSSERHSVQQATQSTPHAALTQASPPRRTARQGPYGPLSTTVSLPCTEPDAIVRLPASFTTLHYALGMIGQALASSGHIHTNSTAPKMVLKHITRRTGAQVRQSDPADRSIYIWGEPQQVIAARNMLEAVLSRCDEEIVTRREGMWAKAHPRWEEREAYERAKLRHEIFLKELKKEPATRDLTSKKLLFMWPSTGPTMTQSLGEELEKLNSIRLNFKVHVYALPHAEDCICVAGFREIDAGPILAQLRELSNATVAQSDARVKAYLIEPPSHDAYMDGVVLTKFPHGAELALFGPPLPADNADHWHRQMAEGQQANKETLRSKVEKALSVCHFFGDHLRMRVHFGSFVLDTVQRPRNATTGYEFEEFRRMLLHDEARGRLIPRLRLDWEEMLERCSQASDLLEPTDPEKPLAIIRNMEPSYSVSFEFLDPHSHVRLETYFKKVLGSREIETANHQWFKLRRDNEERNRHMAMQVSTIDFERCDWQFDLEHLEPLGASTANLSPELEAFAPAVTFDMRLTPAQREFAALPVKKTVISPRPPVSRIIEKSALQFRIKGTSYILELIRFDEYRQRVSTKHQPTNCSSATWGAAVFDRRWTSLLAMSGAESQSDALRFERPTGRIEAFFPSSTGGENQGKEGFWEFLDVVNKVATLLRSASNNKKQGDEQIGASELLRADFGTLF